MLNNSGSKVQVVAAGGDINTSDQVVGLKGVPFCTGFTPTTGQALEYTTASSPNPCYTAATPSGGSGTVQVYQTFTPFMLSPSGGNQSTINSLSGAPQNFESILWSIATSDTSAMSFDVYLPSTYVASSASLTILYTGPGSSNTGSGNIQFNIGTAILNGNNITSLSYTSSTMPSFTSPGYTFTTYTNTLSSVSLPSSPAGNIIRVKISRNTSVSGNSADTIGIISMVFGFQHN
jgi:hypothetical protein